MQFNHSIYKSISGFCLAIGMLLATPSCKETEVKSVDFSISQNQFDFYAEGGNGDITVTSGEEWTVESNVEWCLISPANGNGSVECELRVDTSYLYKAREAVLTFHCGSQSRQVFVNQLGYQKVIQPKDAEFEVPDYKKAEEAFVEVDVVANVDFDIEVPQDAAWLTYEISDAHVSSVPRPRKVKFMYKINTETSLRSANVVLKPTADKDQEAEPAIITINQQGAPLIEPSRAGDSLAIVTISRMMNVYIDPSSDGSAMTHWSNVTLKEFPVENGKEGETEMRVVQVQFKMMNTKESIPYQVKFLTKCEDISFYGNSNGDYRSITWTPEITAMTWLKRLEIVGYGFINMPEELASMSSLEDFDISGCFVDEIPVHIFEAMPSLKHLRLSNNRRNNYMDLADIKGKEDLGMRGELPRAIFMEKLESLAIQHNYIEGKIPDLPVGSMPNLKRLALNGNFLTGDAPQWIMQHPYVGCWEPFIFIFNQSGGKDSNGVKSGLTNEPKRFPDCPLTYY